MGDLFVDLDGCSFQIDQRRQRDRESQYPRLRSELPLVIHNTMLRKKYIFAETVLFKAKPT